MRRNDPVRADSHLHSLFSADGRSEMEEYVRASSPAGVDVLVFTEHMDIGMPQEPGEEKLDFASLDTEAYFARASALRSRYSDTVDIRCGIEAGMLRGRMDEINAFLKAGPFDEIIASQHLFRGHDCYWVKFYYDDLDPRQAVHEWIGDIRQNLMAMESFDILSHPDYMLRYTGEESDRVYALYSDDYAPVLRMLAVNGKALEVNIGSLLRGRGIPAFYEDILRHYRDLGGELVSVGTDAHTAAGYGKGFAEAEELLRRCGFRFYAYFAERRPVAIKL